MIPSLPDWRFQRIGIFISDLLGDALETMDDLIDIVNETADEIVELEEE